MASLARFRLLVFPVALALAGVASAGHQKMPSHGESLLRTLALQTSPSRGWQRQLVAPGVSVSAPADLRPIPGNQVGDDMSKVTMLGCAVGNYGITASVGVFKDRTKADRADLVASYIMGVAIAQGNLTCQIVEERNILLNGWPGIAATLKFSNGFGVTMRCFTIGGRFITVGGGYSGSTRPSYLDRFMNSLRIDQSGPATTAEPEMKLFPLGNSGMYALFPWAPSVVGAPKGSSLSNSDWPTFTASYALRKFLVQYSDLPSNASANEENLKKLREVMSSGVVNTLHGSIEKQFEGKIGGDTALQTDFKVGDHMTGVILVYVHGKRAISLMQTAPSAYDDPETVKAFLSSLKLTP